MSIFLSHLFKKKIIYLRNPPNHLDHSSNEFTVFVTQKKKTKPFQAFKSLLTQHDGKFPPSAQLLKILAMKRVLIE